MNILPNPQQVGPYDTIPASHLHVEDTIDVVRLNGASEGYRHPRATVGEIRVLDGGQTLVLVDIAGNRIGTVGADTPVVLL